MEVKVLMLVGGELRSHALRQAWLGRNDACAVEGDSRMPRQDLPSGVHVDVIDGVVLGGDPRTPEGLPSGVHGESDGVLRRSGGHGDDQEQQPAVGNDPRKPDGGKPTSVLWSVCSFLAAIARRRDGLLWKTSTKE